LVFGISIARQSPAPARRFDIGGELMRPVRRHSDGALLAEGIPCREGVLVYRTASGGERRELVTLDALNDTVETIARAPLTLLHPEQGFVHADSAKELVVGDVDGYAFVEKDAQGGFARVRVAVRRKDALDAVDAGTHELSPGYEVTLDETPGEHPTFGRYDARQIKRVCNHLALVPKGRGDRVVLRTDSADAVQVDTQPAGPARRIDTAPEVRMKPLLIALLTGLGVSRFDSEDAALTEGKAALDKLQSAAKSRKDADEDLEKLKAENAKLKADLEAAKTAAAEEKGKADAMKKDLDEVKKAEDARKDAAELERLRSIAGKVGVKHDGLDLGALRIAIAKTRIDSVDAKSDPAYVSGVIVAIEADAVKRADRWDWTRDGGGKRKDGEGAGQDGTRADADEFYNPHLAAADAARKGGAS
jgi:hypothetical protein